MQMIQRPGRLVTRPQAESVPAVGLGDDAEAVVAAVDVPRRDPPIPVPSSRGRGYRLVCPSARVT